MASNSNSTARAPRWARAGFVLRAFGLPTVALVAIGVGCSSGQDNGSSAGTSTSSRPPNCGNNVLDPDETCDGTQFNLHVTCDFATNHARPAGEVACSADCILDTTTCYAGPPPVGGNTGAGGYGAGGYPTTTGGFSSMGGFTNTGGANQAGFTGFGGSPIPGGGGFQSTGGTPVGGFPTTGGDTGAGGAVSTGGDQGAGGTVGTGGAVVSTGGAPSTGGATGTGGSITTVGEPTLPAAPSDCPTLATTSSTTIKNQQVQLWVGAKRTDVKGPVMFYWHGTGSHSGEAGLLGPAVQEIQNMGGIIVSPETTLATGQTTGNNVWYTGDFDVSDYILACAIQQLNIDTHQIYSAGCSAGGLQAGAMVFSRSGYLAAAMPNSGGTLGSLPFQTTSHIPSVITAHGDSNDFSGLFATASTNECNAVKSAGGIAVDCDHGGSHCGAPSDLVAAQWQFLKDHPFGVKPDPYAGGLPASFPTYCKQF